jgi:hypothetical protein
LALDDDTQHTTPSPSYWVQNGFASTSDLVSDLDDSPIHSPLSIGIGASPFVPESLIRTRCGTQRDQIQGREGEAICYSRIQLLLHVGDFSLKGIDPQLLCPTRNTSLETRHPSTIDTQPDLGIFSPATAATGTYLDGNHINSASPQVQLSTLEAPAHCVNYPSLARKQTRSPVRLLRVTGSGVHRLSKPSPSHRCITLSPLPADREYFDQVIKNLRDTPYLVSPQQQEPTVGSPAGLQLVGLRRLSGPGTAADRESVYAILIDRPLEGAYVCWICGKRRADRRLPRALDHIRGHFKHRPYHCLGTHVNQPMGSDSPLTIASVW